MVQELNELKWLLLPLYPFLVIILFGGWLWVRAKRSRFVSLRLRLLGMSMEMNLGTEARECPRESHTNEGKT